MRQDERSSGSAGRWGPMFGARARDWAETWEGPLGWGTPVYEYVLDRTAVGSNTTLLDCGCGAGRFPRMAADRGAAVAGIDAAAALIAIAGERTSEGDFRVGDLEALPWPDDSFDLVTGFSAFQFADDKVRALSEAGRVARGDVVVVIPVRTAESGIPEVFKSLVPLFPPEALASMKETGMFALSEPGKLEHVISAAALRRYDDEEIECPIVFEDLTTAVRAFVGAGPAAAAVANAGEPAVTEAARAGVDPFTDEDDRVVLPAWYRVVLTRP